MIFQRSSKSNKQNTICRAVKLFSFLLLMFFHVILFGQNKPESFKDLLEEFSAATPEQRLMLYESKPYKDLIKTSPNAVYGFGRFLILDYVEQRNHKKVTEWFEILKEAPSMIRDDMDRRIYEIYQERGDHQEVIDLMGPELENAYKVMKRREDADASQYYFYTPRISHYLKSKLALKEYQLVYDHLSMLYAYTGNKFLSSVFNYQYAEALVALGKNDQALEVFAKFNAQRTDFSPKLADKTNELITSTKDGKSKFDAVVEKAEQNQRDVYRNFLANVKDLDQADLSSKLGNSKYILLNLWGSWCGPCAQTHPKLIQLYNQYKDFGFEVLGIASEFEENPEKRETVLRNEIARQNLPWLQTMYYAKDVTHPAMRFEAVVYPTKVLIDSTGKVLLRISGTSIVNTEMLESMLSELMGDNYASHKAKMLRLLANPIAKFHKADNLNDKFSAYQECLKIDDGTVKEVSLKINSLTAELVLSYMVSGDQDKARSLYLTLQDNEMIAGCLADILELPNLENFYISEAQVTLKKFMNGFTDNVKPEDLNSYFNLLKKLYDRLDSSSRDDLWKENGFSAMRNLFLIEEYAQSGDFSFDYRTTMTYDLAKFFTKKGEHKSASAVLGLYLNLDSNYTFLRDKIINDFSEITNLSTYFEENKPKGTEVNKAYLTKLMLKKDINNDILGLEALKGKYVLLDFWGSWCVPCRASHPHLNEVYKKYKPLGLEIVGLANEGNGKLEVLEANWKTAVNTDQIKWIQLLKNDRERSGFDPLKVFQINAYPTKILFDKDFNIIDTYTGADDAKLDSKLKELFKI